MTTPTRETLSSRLGFLLLSAGCAVGLGNVWRFPYIVGQNGGALFVLIYICFLLFFGLPIMIAEFALGRASQRTIIRAYAHLTPNPGPYRFIAPVQGVCNWLLMMFYTTITGWLLAYPVMLLTGHLDFSDPEASFAAFTGSPLQQVGWMWVTCFIGFGVCALGLQKGVESITKKLMMALFVLLFGLCIYAVFLPNAAEGLAFYLKPNFEVLKERSLFQIIIDALGQSFFTLSLGIGAMTIFASYSAKRNTLMSDSLRIIALDTMVAFLSGLVIFPSCFAFGTKPDQGPNLIFLTLPKMFDQMRIGDFHIGLWVGAVFFIFLALAAITTIIAVFENIIAMSMERNHISRKKAILRTAPLLFLLSIPCALSFNLLGWVKPLGPNSSILVFEDFLVSNFALPLGSLAILIFCVSKRFWGWDRFLAEVNAGEGLRVPRKLFFYVAYILPTILVAVFLTMLVLTFTQG